MSICVKNLSMKKEHVCLLLTALMLSFGSLFASEWLSAEPVWPKGRETEMNGRFGFVARFSVDRPERPVLRVTGSTVYRIFIDGHFSGYGPARGPEGRFRVDEWPLEIKMPGEHVVAVEVASYNCNTYYFMDQPPFLQAEVVLDGRVLASTGTEGAFEAFEVNHITKISRYGFQRGFGEGVRARPDDDDWRLGKGVSPLKLARRPQVNTLPRIVDYPDFRILPTCAVTNTVSKRRGEIPALKSRYLTGSPKGFKCYPQASLVYDIPTEIKRIETDPVASPCPKSGCFALANGHGTVFDVGRNVTGFIRLKMRCRAPAKVRVIFDEIASDGWLVDGLRAGCGNMLVYDLTVAGDYSFEAFEPNTMRFLHVIALEGAVDLEPPTVRTYESPSADGAAFNSSDPRLDKIFMAARETFKQNAVDVFTDCPSRERAGWLCDSFWLGRTSALLTGGCALENLFIENFALAPRFSGIEKGMLPMVYPGDHPNGVYIPNWALWFVIQLDEYRCRGGDMALVRRLEPRVRELLNVFRLRYRNADGLLEDLQSWVFVEWSHANNCCKGVNYPSNMLWAGALDAAARLYGWKDCSDEARCVREKVREQSWDGSWFHDYAIRDKSGRLEVRPDRTEVCQYYAFFFGVAAAESHPVLWRRLVSDFGPQRGERNLHPDIYPANAFIGNYLRLELLSRAGYKRQVLEEIVGYFSKMADRTGTLWEHDDTRASCCHGFASHLSVVCARDALGLTIDRVGKRVCFAPSANGLSRCSGEFPVTDGIVKASWSLANGEISSHLEIPAGWSRVESLSAVCVERGRKKE